MNEIESVSNDTPFTFICPPPASLRLSPVRCFPSVHWVGENAYQIGEPLQNCPSSCEGVKGVKGGFETISSMMIRV